MPEITIRYMPNRTAHLAAESLAEQFTGDWLVNTESSRVGFTVDRSADELHTALDVLLLIIDSAILANEAIPRIRRWFSEGDGAKLCEQVEIVHGETLEVIATVTRPASRP